MNPRPGEVWLADLGISGKTRPVIIVSRYDEDPPRVLVIYVPLTSEDRGSEYEVPMPDLPFLRFPGTANVQGIASLPTKRLEKRLGVLPDATLAQVKQTIRFVLDLD
jgi:mRNA interferase MazF